MLDPFNGTMTTGTVIISVTLLIISYLMGNIISTVYLAVFLGAEYLEKHITINRKKRPPDYISSFEKEDFLNYSKYFNSLKLISLNKKISFDEKKYSREMGKHAVLANSMNSEKILMERDIIFLRTNRAGLKRDDLFKNGKIKKIILKKNYSKNKIINRKDIIIN